MNLKKTILEAKKLMLEEKGHSEANIAEAVEKDLKSINAELQTKSVLDTQTTNNGEEYVPVENNDGRLVDLMVKKGGLVAVMQPGFLGTNLLQNTVINIKGEVGQATIEDEWTTGNFYNVTPEQTVITDKVIANSKVLTARIGISDRLQRYSAVEVLRMAEDALSEQINQAIEDAVLNADNNPGGTGNINSDDQLASTTYGANAAIVKMTNGLRLGVVNGTANQEYLNITGVSGFDDIANLIKLLPADFNPNDYAIVMDHRTNAEFMKKDDFKQASRRSNNFDDNTSRTGVFNTVAGMPIVVSKYMRLTEADGKVSGATPANNTKGTVILFKRNIIQHGFLNSLDMSLDKITGR